MSITFKYYFVFKVYKSIYILYNETIAVDL